MDLTAPFAQETCLRVYTLFVYRLDYNKGLSVCIAEAIETNHWIKLQLVLPPLESGHLCCQTTLSFHFSAFWFDYVTF